MELGCRNVGRTGGCKDGFRSGLSASHQRRTRFSTARLHNMSTVLLLLAWLLSSNCQKSMAYYHECPNSVFSRCGNNYNQRQRKRGGIFVSKSSAKRPRCIRLYSSNDESNPSSDELSALERKLMLRITRLEELVAKQEMEIHRLKRSAEELTATAEAFAQVIQLLREAGLQSNVLAQGAQNEDSKDPSEKKKVEATERNVSATDKQPSGRVVESFDDSLIFGTAPATVSDAADAAGAAILAAVLGGKQRMLVDVRDAELSSDPETLVQFIELAILPIAAGLQGLKSTRNRVKIVFPKVSQLLEYRRTMVLAAPEVVALSTLGFDPVERRDKLVVIVAPEPDDEEGLTAMRELLFPEDDRQPIQQPLVVLNYHMLPVAGLPPEFETAYHLRLLSVQYMSGRVASEFIQESQSEGDDETQETNNPEGDGEDGNVTAADDDIDDIEDEALKAAMKRAQQLGPNHHGVTRAMVIRAYPRPWHVFVDTSPDTDADFEVAATFDDEPTSEELNFAIVECLEGSEREDEIVAQQMQQALEEGQLDRVSDMIGSVLDLDDEEDDSDDDEDEDFDMFEEDSV